MFPFLRGRICQLLGLIFEAAVFEAIFEASGFEAAVQFCGIERGTCLKSRLAFKIGAHAHYTSGTNTTATH